MGASSADEFPLLSALGLYAADVRGDGNCLFNALSDQLYGHQAEHHAIRTKVIAYMREHATYYKQFIDVHPGGGLRRNPKRKNVGAYSSPANFVPPTEADIDRVFEGHLQSMAQGGTYGDNMELSAFSSAFDIDVKIYQRDFAYMVSGSGQGEDGPRTVAHIAYHIWEHYSSIRNLDGPHAGLPHVQARALSAQEEERQKEKLAQTPHVQPWMIDVVSKSLPFLADKPTIKRTLEECKGNIDAAVSKLMALEDGGSVSSTQESSSVEREQDSDDEAYNGPNKKQDRRMSRAARLSGRDREHRLQLSRLAAQESSQESVSSVETDDSSAGEIAVKREDAERNVKPKPSSEAPSDTAARPTIRIKLNGPRPPPPPDPSSIGPLRPSARDRKDMKKQAQKAARKERQQVTPKAEVDNATVKAGLLLRSKGFAETPPIESGIRTLFI